MVNLITQNRWIEILRILLWLIVTAITYPNILISITMFLLMSASFMLAKQEFLIIHAKDSAHAIDCDDPKFLFLYRIYIAGMLLVFAIFAYGYISLAFDEIIHGFLSMSIVLITGSAFLIFYFKDDVRSIKQACIFCDTANFFLFLSIIPIIFK